jgi:hypothetical protein
LNYIKQFQDFKSKKITLEKYIEKVPGSFYSFLIEFRVIRNLPKQTVDLLLIETLKKCEISDEEIEKLKEHLSKAKDTLAFISPDQIKRKS